MKITREMKEWRAAGESYAAIAKRMKCNKETVREAFLELTPTEAAAPAVATKLKGIQMSAQTRVSNRRPTTSIRSRFFELKRGQAFAVDVVAREWGVSAETLRTHARDAECFLYVDMGNEKWVPCVMHPDTAKQYNAR